MSSSSIPNKIISEYADFRINIEKLSEPKDFDEISTFINNIQNMLSQNNLILTELTDEQINYYEKALKDTRKLNYSINTFISHYEEFIKFIKIINSSSNNNNPDLIPSDKYGPNFISDFLASYLEYQIGNIINELTTNEINYLSSEAWITQQTFTDNPNDLILQIRYFKYLAELMGNTEENLIRTLESDIINKLLLDLEKFELEIPNFGITSTLEETIIAISNLEKYIINNGFSLHKYYEEPIENKE